MESDVISVLTNLGYNLRKQSHYYTTAALYRSGSNNNSLVIYPNDDLCIDFVTSQKFSIKKLIALSLNLESEEKVEEWLKYNKITLKLPKPKLKIKMPTIYPPEILNELIPDHSYFVNRGISLDVMKEFRGGVSGNTGKLKNRYVFPIFDGKGNIHGFCGRDITGKSKMKYKILEEKSTFKYPLFLNHKIIKEKKSVVLVEGIPDCLSLFTCGIRNVICIFGTECSWDIVNFLIKYDISNIIISTNNDALDGKNAGNEAAGKIESRLLKYFDRRSVSVHLPTQKKDWNDILQLPNGQKIIRDFFKDLI